MADERRVRVEALAARLHHDDPSQLFFQVNEIAGELSYLRHGIELAPGATVLDVGANVGVAAVFFATHCEAGAVHSFEPVGPLFDLLRRNTEGLDTCFPHNVGMGASEGGARVAYYPDAGAMSSLHADPERDEALVRRALRNAGFSEQEAGERTEGRYQPQMLDCRLTTVSAFLDEEGMERVDLLKVDVERAELDVLRGVEDRHWPAIAQVVVETHDDEPGRVAEIERLLTSRGFSIAVDQDEGMEGTGVRMLYASS